jgi:tRNA modification GTPase
VLEPVRPGLFDQTETIVAVASAIGSAPRAIVRAAGERCFDLLAGLGVRSTPIDRTAFDVELKIEGVHVPAQVYLFRGPRSATGQDGFELHIPGSPWLAKALIGRLISLGARAAEPGEFTARAYFNRRLDLTAAEGVAATIAAGSRQQLDAARQLLCGELSRRLQPLLEAVAQLLALVEVGIDFVDEDVTFIELDTLRSEIDQMAASLTDLLNHTARIDRLNHEPRIVLLGRPNAGKSTLLNLLSGGSRAVVSAVAGTTRDALSARVRLERGWVTLVDVAGVDSSDADPIAAQMQHAARRELDTADAVLRIHSADDPTPLIECDRDVALTLLSKCELGHRSGFDVAFSCHRQIGISTLLHKLDGIAFGVVDARPQLALTARHVEAIGLAIDELRHARNAIDDGAELVAAGLRHAMNHLGGVLGTISPDDLLGRIFSKFCIGK